MVLNHPMSNIVVSMERTGLEPVPTENNTIFITNKYS